MCETLLTREDIDVGVLPDLGDTPLLLALECRQPADRESRVRLLLSHPKTNPNTANWDGVTPLMRAASLGDVAVCRLLLSHPDTELSKTDRNGCTWLKYALDSQDREDVVEFIVSLPDINVDTDPVNPQGDTMISLACSRGHLSILQILLDRPNSNPNVIDADGYSLLGRAASRGDIPSCRLLAACPSVDVNHCDPRGYTPLMHALESSDREEVVEFLLSLPGIDPNADNANGDTPLTLAITRGNLSVCPHFLSHPNINPNARDVHGHTPLTRAVIRGNMLLCRLILSHPRTDVNLGDYNGNTPLWYSVLGRGSRGTDALVELLLRAPAIDPNVRNTRGNSAFFLALSNNYPSLWRLFLSHPKIDLNIHNDQGITPLMHAICARHIELSTLLIELPGPRANNAPGTTHSNTTTTPGDGDIPSGPHSTQDDYGRSAKAVDGILTEDTTSPSHPPLFLDPNVRTKDSWGTTALIQAVLIPNSEIVQFVLSHSLTDVNLGDFRGNSALHYVLQLQSSRETSRILQLLLSHPSIDPNQPNNHGFSPIHLTTIWGNKSICDTLLAHPKIEVNKPTTSTGDTALIKIVKVLSKLAGTDQLSEGENPSGLILSQFTRDVSEVDTSGLGILASFLSHPGLDPDISNERGETALTIAVRQNCLAVVRALVSHPRTDVNLQDRAGMTPLMLACSRRDLDYAQLFDDYEVPGPREDQVQIVEVLASHPRIDLSAQSWDGSRALMVARRCRFDRAVKLILAQMSSSARI